MKKLLLLLILSFLSIQSFAGEVETNILKLKASNACKGCSFIGADLSEAVLRKANLKGADLRGANLYKANFSDADLSGANFSDADLSEANLSNADLNSASLYNANLSKADLYKANLSGANLTEANLSGANPYNANLSKADLYKANLRGADLRGADLRGANLTGAFICNTKTSYGIDNSGCKEAEVEVKVSSTEVLDDNFTVYLGYLLYYSNYCDKSSITKLAEYYRQYNIIHSKFIKNPLAQVGFNGADKMGCFTMKPFLTDAGLL